MLILSYKGKFLKPKTTTLNIITCNYEYSYQFGKCQHLSKGSFDS